MQTTVEKIDDSEFKLYANQALDLIEDELEHLFETSDFDVDVERQGGNVLNIQFPNHTVIVINLQTPLHELWLATKEGGFHFRWAGSKVKPKWQDTKTQEDFFAVVASHITKQGGTPFNLTGLGQ